jgi:hypothetical protein
MRAQLRGYRCMYVPRAVVQHYQAGTLDDHNPFKTFLLQRNKWYVVLKTFPLGLLWHCWRDLARSYAGAMLHVWSLPEGKKLVWMIHRSLLKHLPRILLLRCLLAWRRKPGATRRIARWVDRHNATYRELDQAAAVGRYYEDLRRRVDAHSDR